MTARRNPEPMEALAHTEHMKGVLLVEEEIWKAQAALVAGQLQAYKARLQSALISIQFLLREEVGE